MGLFDMFKKKADNGMILGATAKGTVVPMEEIPDPVFSEGILGPCVGIDPTEGAVYAPCDGKITQLADTLHAVGLLSASGIEVLIHVGVDTVEMKGDGFASSLKVDDEVKKGQQLLTMDLAKIAAANHPATVINVVTNADDFAEVTVAASGTVEPGAEMFRVSK